MLDKILDRVKKLLRLAEGTSNVNEAAAAAAAAQKLITEHNLGLVSLEDENGAPAEPARSAHEPLEREVIRLPGSRLMQWELQLLQGVCATNRTRCIYVNPNLSGKQHGYTILGAAADRATTVYLFHYLRRQVDEIATKALVTRIDDGTPGKTWGNNFRTGMVDTLRQRLEAMHQQVLLQAPASAYATGDEHAIVRVSEALTVLKTLDEKVRDAALALRGKGQRHSFGNAAYSSNAREEGRRAGHRVNLNAGKALK